MCLNIMYSCVSVLYNALISKSIGLIYLYVTFDSFAVSWIHNYFDVLLMNTVRFWLW